MERVGKLPILGFSFCLKSGLQWMQIMNPDRGGWKQQDHQRHANAAAARFMASGRIHSAQKCKAASSPCIQCTCCAVAFRPLSKLQETPKRQEVVEGAHLKVQLLASHLW